eukprot:157944-Prorocentrum_minimum.AAC.1
MSTGSARSRPLVGMALAAATLFAAPAFDLVYPNAAMVRRRTPSSSLPKNADNLPRLELHLTIINATTSFNENLDRFMTGPVSTNNQHHHLRGINLAHRPIAVPQYEYTSLTDQSQSLYGNVPHPGSPETSQLFFRKLSRSSSPCNATQLMLIGAYCYYTSNVANCYGTIRYSSATHLSIIDYRGDDR